MANLTLKQASDIVRANIGELDSQKIEKGLLDLYITLAQRKVQQDLLPLLGMKQFTKEALLSANYMEASFDLPSDIMSTPDAIVKVQASSTTVFANATTQNGAANGNIKLTSKLPGTLGNGMICLIADAPVGVTPISIVWAYTTNIDFNVYIDGGVTTANQLVAALNADVTFSKYFTASLAQTLGTGTVGEETLTLSGGTGTPFYSAKEITIEGYVDEPNNTYLAPAVTVPKYVLKGNTAGTRKLDFLPTTINYAKVFYKYNLVDPSDSVSLSIPTEYEELVIDKATAKCFEKLEKNAESQAKQVEYANKVKEYENNYVTNRNAIVAEKTRLQTNDTSN